METVVYLSVALGWIFNRKMDNSDHQYASFRKNLPTLILVLSGYLIATFGIKQISRLDVYRKQSIAIKSTWYLLFSTVFLLALFGASALKVFAILSIHYILIKARPVQSISAPLLSWIFSISILLLNHFYDGYRFGSISNHLAFLDNVKGVGIRWNITFNFTVLRMISFAMDRYWYLKDPDVPSRLHLESCTICNESPNMCKRSRSETSHKVSDYNFFNYMLYCIYAPLYMAGPIVTFNDFLHQMKHTPRSINLKDSITYTLRWFAIVFLMEVMMHFSYVVAIKDTKAWKGFSPMEIFLVGFFNLKMIWLKLMIIWRFFRMWAMLDGVETLENMGRCMSNHYSGVQFWRDWHTSFNRWLIRFCFLYGNLAKLSLDISTSHLEELKQED